MMPRSIYVTRVAASIVFVLFCLINSTLNKKNAKDASVRAQAPSIDWDRIIVDCKKGLDFASIEDFELFMNHFKQASQEQLINVGVRSKCIKQRQAILDLDKLIVTERVCDPYQIDNLISYHKKYFKSNRLSVFSAKAITQKFFSRYAIQVAYTCKKNLIANLKESRSSLDSQAQSLEQAREKIFKELPELKSNFNLITEQPGAPTNVRETSETEQALGGYREALTRLRQPEDVLTFEQSECKTSSTRRIVAPVDEVKTYFKPALICLNLAQYYSGNVLSIARLANFGYTATEPDLDVRLADSSLVKDWIIAVQVCEPMLHMRTEKIDEQSAIIDTCSERVTTPENLMVFDDKLAAVDNEKLDEWLSVSVASRDNNQKIMKSAMKEVAKKSLRRHILQGGTLETALKELKSNVGLQPDRLATTRQLSRELATVTINTDAFEYNHKSDDEIDQESVKTLIEAISEDCKTGCVNRKDEPEFEDVYVSYDPLTSFIATLTIFAIMMAFEWIFFIVMTLSARIFHRMHTKFDHLLVFPPRVMSWKDAKFVKYTKMLEDIDEDDFFDYQELTPEEQKQRDLLAKVFGRPPPMLYRD